MAEESSAGARLVGYDLARGLAVFGMILVNFKFVMGWEGVEAGWLGRLAGLCDGRAAATFVVLAGVGVSLLCRRARQARDLAALSACRLVLVKRAAFLLVLGYLDSLLWVGDILHFYAAYLLIAAAFVDTPDWALWTLSGLSVLTWVCLFLFLDYELGWDWEAMRYAGQWRWRGLLRHLFFNGFHPVFPWISFLLIGLWLGRNNLSAPAAQWRLLVWGALAAVAAELLSRRLTGRASAFGDEDAEWAAMVFGTQSMPPAPLYLVSGGGTALAVIALCLRAADLFAQAPWLAVAASAGRLALTLYVAHVLLGMKVLEALGWLNGKSLEASVSCSVAFYAGCLAFAWAWRRRFAQGPLEAVMRRVSG